jgi:DNA-binding transcriptional LysR family regulator
MSMDMVEIRSVVVVARTKSFSAAARELHISQPALSRRIAQAEESLGVSLFERLPRGAMPTDACLAFLCYAETALASIKDAHEAARETGNETRRELAVGFVEAVCDPWLTSALREVVAQEPDTRLIFRPHILSEDVSADVLSGEVKLGIRYRRDDHPLLESINLFQDRLTVICAPDHVLAGRSTVSVEELARQQWLGYPVSPQRANSYNAILSRRGFGAWQVVPLDSVLVQEQLVSAGFGIALVRHTRVARQLKEGTLVEIDTPIAASVPVALAWRRNAHLGKRGEMLRDRIIANASEMVMQTGMA